MREACKLSVWNNSEFIYKSDTLPSHYIFQSNAVWLALVLSMQSKFLSTGMTSVQKASKLETSSEMPKSSCLKTKRSNLVAFIINTFMLFLSNTHMHERPPKINENKIKA